MSLAPSSRPTLGTAELPQPVRRLAPPDLPATAQLHARYLGRGFFPQLGSAFLRRWHRTFIDNRYGSAHVVTDTSGQVLAFILAATDQQRYLTSTLRTAKWPLTVLGAVALVRRPALGVFFVRTRVCRYVRKLLAHPSRSAASVRRVAVVHAIVTAEPARGRGLGRELLTRFEADVAVTGVHTMELVTDEGGGAIGFYRRLGWTQRGVQVNRDGRRVVCFTKEVGR